MRTSPRFGRYTRVYLLLIQILILPGCSSSRRAIDDRDPAHPSAHSSPPLFVDAAHNAGIQFAHTNGADAHEFNYIESTPAGCAFVDYDGDGWPDIVLVQSGPSGRYSKVANRPHCALYHNNGDGTFSDVTAGSGLDADLGYAHGIAVGDYDNDGFDDLFITSFAGNHLLHNEPAQGTGTGASTAETRGKARHFVDVTVKMGLDKVHSSGYATSAAWGDFDNDGKLDLYVCYYAPWTWDLNKSCKNPQGNQDYCSPTIYDPETHVLYHNLGSRFEDVSQKSGISKAKGRGLAVAWIDYDGDGWQDIFVANDLSPNMLWHNNGNGTFSEVALKAGCSQTEDGKEMAAMGVAVADYDHSGRESLFVTNFSGLPNTIFRNVNGQMFQDVGIPSGVALPHMKFLSFGCEFFDYDADGWPDILVANGHVQIAAALKTEGATYKERKQLLHNERNGHFNEIADRALLGDLTHESVARGLAVADYDNDGRLDALFNSQNGPAELFHNQDRSANHWVSFKTIGTKSNRDGLHARFKLTAGGMTQTSTVRAGSSYLSSSDRRLYFGLGSASVIDSVEISWPGGTKDLLKNIQADKIYVVTEGKGITGSQPLGTHR